MNNLTTWNRQVNVGVVYRLVLQFTKLIRWVRFPSPTPNIFLKNMSDRLETWTYPLWLGYRKNRVGKVLAEPYRTVGINVIISKVATARSGRKQCCYILCTLLSSDGNFRDKR